VGAPSSWIPLAVIFWSAGPARSRIASATVATTTSVAGLRGISPVQPDLGHSRNNTNRMNVGIHEATQCFMDQSMSLKKTNAAELLGCNQDSEMALTGSGAFMSGVEMALVDDLELRRMERLL
jgi:hypothetical protein